MKLVEIAQPVDLGKIKRTLNKYGIIHYSINDDGSVNVDDNVSFFSQRIKSIPVQFHRVTGDFDCRDTKITSLAGAPQVVIGNLWCNNTKITSLSGVHKIIKQVNGMFIAPNATHLLGLLLIDSVMKIRIVDNNPVTNILNRHLKDRDVILAQDELLDAGFVEQAKL